MNSSLHSASSALPAHIGDCVFLGSDLVVERVSDGGRFPVTYTRICDRHQWASLEFYDINGGQRCPRCSVDFEVGQQRYTRLHTRMAAPVGCRDQL